MRAHFRTVIFNTALPASLRRVPFAHIELHPVGTGPITSIELPSLSSPLRGGFDTMVSSSNLSRRRSKPSSRSALTASSRCDRRPRITIINASLDRLKRMRVNRTVHKPHYNLEISRWRWRWRWFRKWKWKWKWKWKLIEMNKSG